MNRRTDSQPITDAYLAKMRDEIASSFDSSPVLTTCPCRSCVDSDRMASLRLAAEAAISAGCRCWLCLAFEKGGKQ